MRDLSEEELARARRWWALLPDSTKGICSIWTILALYAKHVLETETVKFAGNENDDEVTGHMR